MGWLAGCGQRRARRQQLPESLLTEASRKFDEADTPLEILHYLACKGAGAHWLVAAHALQLRTDAYRRGTPP